MKVGGWVAYHYCRTCCRHSAVSASVCRQRSAHLVRVRVRARVRIRIRVRIRLRRRLRLGLRLEEA